jgi:hypothetical protein
MGKSPFPEERTSALSRIGDRKMITIEPILDFDTGIFAEQIYEAGVFQVNIGADSGRNGLPEPSVGKIEKLISMISPYTKKIHLKKNLRRLLPEHDLYGKS